MRQHLSNATYGVLDYAAYPAIMLAATPALVHHLGLPAYGIWLTAHAAISVGSIVSSGFGDAVIQRIAILRIRDDLRGIRAMIANMLAINLLLGIALATLLWCAIPLVSGRITQHDPALRASCILSLRLGSFLILLKSVESVFISVMRAFQKYAPTVRVSIATRLLTIALSVILAIRSYGVPAIMLATALALAAGTLAQWNNLRSIKVAQFLPAFDRLVCLDLAAFGIFSWLQAVAGVFFSQADRLLLAVTLGASAVSYYGICVQMAQPIHGLTAAALHFIFPHLSRHHAAGDSVSMRRSIAQAFIVNILLSSVLAMVVVGVGPSFIERWMGPAFASESSRLLPLLAVGFALLSWNVTGHYALLALGRVRLVAASNLAGGTMMLVAIVVLVPHQGQAGAAWARLLFAAITCLIYVPIVRLFNNTSTHHVLVRTTATEEA